MAIEQGGTRKLDSSQDVAVTTSVLPTGASTSANQLLDYKAATTITEYNITLTIVDTEYSQALPANTRKIEFQNRNNNDMRWSFTTGKVATPTAPYQTLKGGMLHWEEGLNLASVTIYFANDNAGDVVELKAWS